MFMTSKFREVYKPNLTSLMVVAGTLYSSWPLGYIFNPVGNRGLASNLQALYQPYNWLFIGLDIVSGLIVCAVCYSLLNFVNNNTLGKTRNVLRASVLGTGVFGFLTALDAVLPLNCLEGSAQCISPLNNPYFVTHGIVSIGSIGGLTLSIFAIWLLLFWREKAVMRLAHIPPALFMIIWFSFGVLTLILLLHNKSSDLAQHFFIGFCSLWLVVFPYFVHLVVRLKPSLLLSEEI